MAITLDGTNGITTPDVNSDGLTVDTTTLVVDEANNRVGIGTSSPTTQLSLFYANGANLNVKSRAHLGATYSSDTLVLGYSVKADPAAVDQMIGTETNSGGGAPAAILMNSGTIQFHTNSSITSGAAFSSERARIDSSGNLLVGTTSNSGAISNPGVYLRPTSDSTFTSAGTPMQVARTTSNGRAIGFFRNSTVVGEITVTTSSTSYVTSSDYRLKENVVGVTGASARVQQLNPVRFNFIADPDRTVDGFLAHEVQDVVPEAITGTRDEVDAEGNPVYQGIDQSKLVPLLTAALQEALTKIETLEARVAALEAA